MEQVWRQSEEICPEGAAKEERVLWMFKIRRQTKKTQRTALKILSIRVNANPSRRRNEIGSSWRRTALKTWSVSWNWRVCKIREKLMTSGGVQNYTRKKAVWNPNQIRAERSRSVLCQAAQETVSIGPTKSPN